MGYISCATFSPGGQTVLTGSADGMARLWDATTGRPVGTPMQHGSGVAAVTFSPDGRTILTASLDKTARLWDATSGRAIGTPLQHEDAVWHVAFSPDGKMFLTSKFNRGGVRFWDAATRHQVGPDFEGGGIPNDCFGPDGRTVLRIVRGALRRWDATTGRPVGPDFEGVGVSNAWFGPGGRTVLGRVGNALRLWDATTGRPVGPDFAAGISLARPSPDGRTVLGVTGSSARVWDIASGQQIGIPIVHGNNIMDAKFSPDSKTILTGSVDGTARLWDAGTGRPTGPPIELGTVVDTVHFGPDGSSILLVNQGNRARVLHVAMLPDDLERIAPWIEAITGLRLDEQGSIVGLDDRDLLERTNHLTSRGGPPAMKVRSLDPIIYSDDPTARAKAWISRKRWDDAAEAFDEALRLRPFNADIWVERGEFHVVRGRRRDAYRDFVKAFHLGARGPRFYGIISGDEKIMELIFGDGIFFREFIAEGERPAAGLWVERGLFHARSYRWGEAAADFLEAENLESSVQHNYRRLLSLWAGHDDSGLNRERISILERHGKTTDPANANSLAWLLAVAPGGEESIGSSLRLAEFASRAAVPEKWIYLNTLGVVLYRSGRFNESILRLEEGIAMRGMSTPQDWVFLALAHHRVGHTREARAWLGKFDDYKPSSDSASFWDELEVRLLRNEAEAAILWDPIFPAQPFAR